MKIAISGKGGVGKTTLAAGLGNFFADQNYRVYAVDADPDASLGLALGLDEERVAGLKPVVELREAIAAKTGGEGAFYTLNPQVDDLLEDYSIALGNLLFFKMGTVKQGGTTCYCRENSVLNAVLNALLLDKKEIVILDMGAGIEHLTRGTARGVDVMLVVSEPTRVSVQTALVVTKLAQDLGIQRVRYVGNKVHSPQERDFLFQNLPAADILGVLGFDDQMWAAAREAGSVPTTGLQQHIRTIAEALTREVGPGALL